MVIGFPGLLYVLLCISFSSTNGQITGIFKTSTPMFKLVELQSVFLELDAQWHATLKHVKAMGAGRRAATVLQHSRLQPGKRYRQVQSLAYFLPFGFQFHEQHHPICHSVCNTGLVLRAALIISSRRSAVRTMNNTLFGPAAASHLRRTNEGVMFKNRRATRFYFLKTGLTVMGQSPTNTRRSEAGAAAGLSAASSQLSKTPLWKKQKNEHLIS